MVYMIKYESLDLLNFLVSNVYNLCFIYKNYFKNNRKIRSRMNQYLLVTDHLLWITSVPTSLYLSLSLAPLVYVCLSNYRLTLR
jgi:hypothetical protein